MKKGFRLPLDVTVVATFLLVLSPLAPLTQAQGTLAPYVEKEHSLPMEDESKESTRRPNILVILLDDAGWRDVGFAGNTFVETPHMDSLAAAGMQFTDAYATHPFCTPTRQSMISGQNPARTAWKHASEVRSNRETAQGPPHSPAVAHKWTNRHPEFQSLAEQLNKVGYRTGHIGKWHFGLSKEITPEREGFDVSFGGAPLVGALHDYYYPYERLDHLGITGQEGEYMTHRLTVESLRFIRNNQNSPFFLQLWHYAPHMPLEAPENLVEKYRRKERSMEEPGMNPTYAAMIESVDQGIGRIMDELRQLGLQENTLVFLTSDNGARTHLGSVPVTSVEPLRGEKGFELQGGVRVPMVVRWPGHVEAGSTSELPVSVLDFYPTILEVAKAPLPEGQPVDGHSLTSVLLGGQQTSLKDRSLYFYNVTDDIEATGVLQPVGAIRRGPYKFYHNFYGRNQLYNVDKDPGEKNNLISARPGQTKAMEQQVKNWVSAVGIASPMRNSAYDPGFIIPRQVAQLDLSGAERVAHWGPGNDLEAWKARRLSRISPQEEALRVFSKGIYPVIAPSSGLPRLEAGVYAVQVTYRFPTAGRFRFSWRTPNRSDNGVIEFFPTRDGDWHTLRAVFESEAPVNQISLDAPTHLHSTGLYDPSVYEDFYEVRDIRLYRIDAATARQARRTSR